MCKTLHFGLILMLAGAGGCSDSTAPKSNAPQSSDSERNDPHAVAAQLIWRLSIPDLEEARTAIDNVVQELRSAQTEDIQWSTYVDHDHVRMDFVGPGSFLGDSFRHELSARLAALGWNSNRPLRGALAWSFDFSGSDRWDMAVIEPKSPEDRTDYASKLSALAQSADFAWVSDRQPFRRRYYAVELSLPRLRALGLSVSGVCDALFETEPKLLTSNSGDEDALTRLEEISLATQASGSVLLRDVARVEIRRSASPTSQAAMPVQTVGIFRSTSNRHPTDSSRIAKALGDTANKATKVSVLPGTTLAILCLQRSSSMPSESPRLSSLMNFDSGTHASSSVLEWCPTSGILKIVTSNYSRASLLSIQRRFRGFTICSASFPKTWAGHVLQMQLHGDSVASLSEMYARIAAKLRAVPELIQVSRAVPTRRLDMRVQIDEDKAEALGVRPTDIERIIAIMSGGFWSPSGALKLTSADSPRSAEKLLSVTVATAGGLRIPLRTMASLATTEVYSQTSVNGRLGAVVDLVFPPGEGSKESLTRVRGLLQSEIDADTMTLIQLR